MERIKVLGDSHIQAFDVYSGDLYKFDTSIVHGATARGAINPNTKTNALNIFKEHLKKDKADRIIICLGEVDCGYLIWYKHKFDGLDPIEQMEESLNRLYAFVKAEVLPLYKPSQIVLMGSIPPTIKDNTDKRYLAGARSKVDTPLKDRIELTNLYNKRMKEICNSEGWKCIDVTNEIVEANGIDIKEHYLNANPFDHHLNPKSHLELILEHL